MSETNKSAATKHEAFPYLDILNLPHPVSKKHERMSIENRAAQFMPFAALTGYDDEIKEAGRITSDKKALTEDTLSRLDEALSWCLAHEREHPLIEVTYFSPDSLKAGGEYITITDNLLKLETFERKIFLKNKTFIPFENIYKIVII